MSEHDYSHRSLLDKLGVKSDSRVAVVDVNDDNFLRDLGDRVSSVAKSNVSDADVVFFQTEQVAELARMGELKTWIKQNGGIWVIYPKGRQDIREADVISAGPSAGLIDNKVVKFSETHTALRFVIPLKSRS